MDLPDGYAEDLHGAKETRCVILSPQSNVLLSGQLVLALVCNPEWKNQLCYKIFWLQTTCMRVSLPSTICINMQQRKLTGDLPGDLCFFRLQVRHLVSQSLTPKSALGSKVAGG